MGQTDKNSTGASLLSGGSLSFALCFMLFLYAPYELFLTNRREFRFTAGQMLPYTLVLFAERYVFAFSPCCSPGRSLQSFSSCARACCCSR